MQTATPPTYDRVPDTATHVLSALPLDASGRTAPLTERLAHRAIPGVAIAVLDGGEIAWEFATGIADAGTGEPVTTETRFQAASISKPVTAMATMRLVGEGVLDLDADVNRYLRTWRLPANGGWQPVVTLRQLLSHTAGTTVHGFVGYGADGPIPTLQQVLDGVLPCNSDPVRVTALPGTIFRYSGGGTSIVQQVIEDVTDTPFEEAMESLVLGPLGMTASTFARQMPGQTALPCASGHRIDRSPVAGGWKIHPEQAAAGLWTTPGDLLRAAREVQRAITDETGSVLTRASAETMLEGRNAGPVGIGFFLDGGGETQRFAHGGGNDGFTCVLEAYARHGKALAVMMNSDLGFDLFPEIIGAVAREHGWPVEPGTRLGTYVGVDGRWTTDEALDAFAGRYELRADYPVEVSADGGALTLSAPGQPSVALRRIGEAAFSVPALDATVTFSRDDSGKIVDLALAQSGEERRASRIE